MGGNRGNRGKSYWIRSIFPDILVAINCAIYAMGLSKEQADYRRWWQCSRRSLVVGSWGLDLVRAGGALLPQTKNPKQKTPKKEEKQKD